MERGLVSRIAQALLPGGLLFYQTFAPMQPGGTGPRSPQFRLAENELLTLFPDLMVRYYREDAGLVSSDTKVADIAMLVAQKPAKVSP